MTSGVLGDALWLFPYVHDETVSTAPRSSCVAAVCRRDRVSGVVFGRVAGVWPMVTNVCWIQSSFYNLRHPNIHMHRRAAAEVVQKGSREEISPVHCEERFRSIAIAHVTVVTERPLSRLQGGA